MNRLLPNVLLALLLVTLAGCGFHLKGQVNIADSIKVMYIQGVKLNKGIGKKLKLGLRQNGVQVVESFQQGAAVLTVHKYKIDRRVLSVGGADAKVSEYELYGILKYRVSDGEGKMISQEQQLEAYRDYRFDKTQVLAKQEEEDMLRDEIDQQLVDTIIRRLSLIQ
jgi:LPS-assembly lipoprotein